MKKILALLLLLAMGLAMTACERSDVVAVVEGKEIHLPEAKEVYDFYIKQQIDIAMYYGIQITPDYPGYKDFIASMKTGTLNMMVENIAKELTEAGLDVIYDDRTKVSPGVKFADAELLGVPVIVVVGRGLANGLVEVRPRSGQGQEVPLADVLSQVQSLI